MSADFAGLIQGHYEIRRTAGRRVLALPGAGEAGFSKHCFRPTDEQTAVQSQPSVGQ